MGIVKIDSMYDALVADGAQIGTKESFKKFMLAPGKQGYQNRLNFYNAMKADGANIGNTYEDFKRSLGLASKGQIQKIAERRQKAQAKAVPQQTNPQTAAQRAISQGYKQTQQPVDYLGRPMNQRGKAPVNAPKNASPFVKSLYEIDNAKNGADYPIDYTSPKAIQQVHQRNQQVRKQAAKTAAKQMSYEASHGQPIMQTNTPADTYVGKTEGQLMDEMNDSAQFMSDSLFKLKVVKWLIY